jgi:hypothetical protein
LPLESHWRDGGSLLLLYFVNIFLDEIEGNCGQHISRGGFERHFFGFLLGFAFLSRTPGPPSSSRNLGARALKKLRRAQDPSM